MGAEPAVGADHLDDADHVLMLALARELGAIDDPGETRRRMAMALGNHLHLARAVFARWDATDGIEVDGEFHDQVPPLAGFDGTGSVTVEALAELSAGRPVTNDDAELAIVPALYSRARHASQTRSIAIVPLRHRRTLVAVFLMVRTHPSPWTRRELALATAFAERAWFASEHHHMTVELHELQSLNRQLVQHTYEGYWERVVTEAKLRALTETLEDKVRSRTRELETANAAMARSEANFRALITSAPYAVIVVQDDDRIAYANPAAVSMLRYPDEAAIIGLSYDRLVHPEDHEKVAQRIRRERAKLPNPMEELRWRGYRDIEIWVEVSSIATDYDGKPASFAMARDISARRKAEQALVASLREKEVLLREIHHRVKNNLQVVSSMLSMQAGLTEDDAARAQLEESRARIHSIGLVHEHLYRSKDLSRLDLRNYIQSLVQSLAIALDSANHHIRVETHVEDLRLDVDKAIACGLVVSELVTNAFKHAFGGRDEGRVEASLVRDGDEVVVSVSDDGVGLPPGFETRPSTTLGFELVRAFVQQLDGQLAINRGKGTTFELRFREA